MTGGSLATGKLERFGRVEPFTFRQLASAVVVRFDSSMLTPRGSPRARLAAAGIALLHGQLGWIFTAVAMKWRGGAANSGAGVWGLLAGFLVLMSLSVAMTPLWRRPGATARKSVGVAVLIAELAWITAVTVHDLRICWAAHTTDLPGLREQVAVVAGVVADPGYLGLLVLVPLGGASLGTSLWLFLGPAHSPGESPWERVRARREAQERDPKG